MRLSRVCLAFWLLTHVGGLLQGGVAYRSPDHEFSLRLPDNWRVAFDKEEPFPVILGPANDIDSPSVIVTAYPTQLDLMVFATEAMKDFVRMDGYRIERQDGFLTASRRRGMKVVASAQSHAEVYTQIFYFIEGRQGCHYVFLATLPRERLHAYETQLDSAIKTLCHSGEAPEWVNYLKAQPRPPKMENVTGTTQTLSAPVRASQTDAPAAKPAKHRGVPR